MAKEWILNNATNRFQLNFKRNVGATSASIRECSPKTMEQWREYYYTNVRSEQQIEELGRILYVKITEVLQAEIEEITEQDCIDYIKQLVIDRTYDGYTTEIKTIYGQLQKDIPDYKIEPACDEWDRLYNVDFFIKVNKSYIGLQIKPVNQGIQLSEIFKEKNIQKHTHKKFTEKYNGNVFYIFSSKKEGGSNAKEIVNKEVVYAIKEEIKRLEKIY
ncbi:MAG: MjaI family restriction endonuclease [Bacteroidales bacterium]|nr:MjaI family restriction endonuclease [Bacteroidales bacterium]